LKKFNHIHDHFTYYIKHRLSGYTICLNTGEGTSRTTSSTQGTSETSLLPADTSPSIIPDIQGEPLDRADWPALCDPVRTELVCRGPYQTSPDFTFPKRDEGRSCHNNHFYRKLVNGEKIKRSWLVYSRKKNTLYCFCCKLFSQKNYHLISSGLNDWKNCSEVLKSTFVCRGYS